MGRRLVERIASEPPAPLGSTAYVTVQSSPVATLPEVDTVA